MIEHKRSDRTASPHNFQLRHHQLIQQIRRVLEPFILHEGSISLLGCLHRSMAKKMLNVRDGGTRLSNRVANVFCRLCEETSSKLAL